MSEFYTDWGFTESPFNTEALEATAEGEKILVGREREITKLGKRLGSKKITVVEGPNGIGKTSLINVALFKGFKDFDSISRENRIVLPCKTPFQLEADSNIGNFQTKVFYEIAQTMIGFEERISKVKGSAPDTRKVDKWLNASAYETFRGSLKAVVAGWGLGAGAGKGTIPNLSQGFANSGFEQSIREWLNSTFQNTFGGIVCVIDNLELLETSEKARKLLGQLRDPLLAQTGLRWVFSGSKGITYSYIDSTRLTGYFHDPLVLGKIELNIAPKRILDARVEAYKSTETPYLPFVSDDFVRLFHIFRGNIRALLHHVDSYCYYIEEEMHQEIHPSTEEEKGETFKTWLKDKCHKVYMEIKAQVKPTAWKIFVDAVEFGGSFSPSDYERFEFKSIQAMRPHIKDLESVGLLQLSQDDTDKRRKTGNVTPKGWLVSIVDQNDFMDKQSSLTMTDLWNPDWERANITEEIIDPSELEEIIDPKSIEDLE